MAEADIEGAASQPAELMLDPFGFMPGVASRIAGLGGGAAPGHDPSYVFHTSYVEAAPGPAHFTVTFDGLNARRGTLVLRVHMLRMEDGAQAALANSDRMLINRLVSRGSRAQIRFEGFRGVSYALMATIPDDSDVIAQGVTVTLDRPADPNDRDDVVIEGRSTSFGTNATRPAVQLLAPDRAKLAQPASQLATAPQLDEPIFAEWRRRIGTAGQSPLAEWQAVYILQALERYGMLQEGARGVGFGARGSPVTAAIAARGIDMLATDLAHDEEGDPSNDTAELAALRRPKLCADGLFARHVAFRAIGMAPLPRDIVNFDFLWSSGIGTRLGSIAAGLRFIDQAMTCLRPGGVAVHTVAYDVAARGLIGDSGRDAPFGRPDIERLALNLISHEHEIAQIRIDEDKALTDAPRGRVSSLSSFGIIVRKAVTPF